MLVGPGRRALRAPLRSSVTSAAHSICNPSTIGGLSGWWNAGSVSDLLDPTARPVAEWGQAVGGLLDKSGHGRTLQPFGFGPQAVLPAAMSHLNGLLGGVGRITAGPGTLWPALDPD